MSLIHLESVFAHGATYRSQHPSACGDPVFPTPFLEDAFFSPDYVFDIFVKCQMAEVAFTHALIFSFVLYDLY